MIVVPKCERFGTSVGNQETKGKNGSARMPNSTILEQCNHYYRFNWEGLCDHLERESSTLPIQPIMPYAKLQNLCGALSK